MGLAVYRTGADGTRMLYQGVVERPVAAVGHGIKRGATLTNAQMRKAMEAGNEVGRG